MSTSDSFGKDQLNDLIEKAVHNKCTFEWLLIKINTKTKCISEYDKVYIEKKYCELLTALWLREVPELIELTKPDDIVNSINSIRLVQHFDECCKITTKTKSEYNDLVCQFSQISAFLKNQEKQCIARLKKACLDKISQHADFLKCEQSFFEHILQLLKLRPDLDELCDKLQLNEILNESGESGFKKFLIRLQTYETHDLQILAIKHHVCDLLNLDQYFLLADLKRILRSYLQEPSITPLVVDGREILEVSGSHIVLSKLISKVEKHQSFSKIDEVRFVKADAIHIDVNLAWSVWHGKNIVIHANSIIVNKSEQLLWNVSGLSGNDRTDIPSPAPHGVNDVGGGGGGRGGEGNPGESGGNVMIIAENVYNGQFLKIISNGGNGSNGKDGMRGKDGEDGVSISNTEFKNEFPPVSKLRNAEKQSHLKTTYEGLMNGLRSVEDCFVGNIKHGCIRNCFFKDLLNDHINELGNIYFEVTMENNCKVTFSFYNSGLFTFCQSFLLFNGSPGLEGTSGATGGEGGNYGFAGDINICTMQNDTVRIKSCSNDGIPGKRGKPGENGKSGKSGLDKAYMDHTNLTIGHWPELFLPTKNDSYTLETKYRMKKDGKCVYTPHNNMYVKIVKCNRDTRKQLSFKESFTEQKNSWSLSSNTNRKKTICLESVVQKYGSVSSRASSNECDFTIDTFKDILKDIAADLEVEEVLEETSVKRICNTVSRLKSHIFEYRDWFKHKIISTCDEAKTLKNSLVCTDELIKLIEETPTDIELWESLLVARLDFDSVLQIWTTAERLLTKQNTQCQQVKALLIGKLKLMALEYVNSLKIPTHSQSGQSKTKPPLELCDVLPFNSNVSHCEKVVQFLCEDTLEMRMNLKDLCETSHQESYFLEALKFFILEYGQSFLRNVKIYNLLKKKLHFDKHKQSQLQVKLQPFKGILTSSKHLFETNIDDLLKKSANEDTHSQICLDKAINSSDDQFLKYCYNVYCTEVRTNFDWSDLEDIKDMLKCFFLSYIKRYGPLMKSSRDLIANALGVNILIYVPVESEAKLVLIDNHNSKGYKEMYFLLKDNKFFFLDVDKDHLETDTIHNKIILHVDSFTDIKEFIDFHTDSPFMSANYDIPNKSSSLKKEVKNILEQNSDMQALKQMYSSEENALLLNKWIDKLSLNYLENSNILHFMMLRLKIEGKVISAMELSFVLSFLVKLSLKSANIISKLSWIIASHHQSLWLVEITLLTLNHCFEHAITPEKMHKWRNFLKNLDDKSTLMLLLEKHSLERTLGRHGQISTKWIEEILFLSSHVRNSHIGLDDIDLCEWKYYLKDKFWACQLLKVTNWSENDLKSICYSMVLLENIIKMNMCIKIVDAMRKHEKITLKDKNEIKDTLRVLCSGEISVNENLIRNLSSMSICHWKDILKNQQKLGNERHTAQLIKMIKDSGNTSDLVLKSLPDLASIVHYVKAAEEKLREKIKTKDDLKKWTKDLIASIPNNSEDFGSVLKNVGLVIAKLDSYLLNLQSTIERLIKQSSEDNTKLSGSNLNESKDFSVTESLKCMLVATVFLAIDIVLKIQLRDTQILAILTFLIVNANILGQVSTGEGKSIIIVAVTIVNALLSGFQVDIITSSHVLAERDAKKYNELYEIFNLSAGHNSDSDMEERKKSYSNCQIVYGELGSFQRDFLLDRFYSKNIMGDRKFKLVIIDEVDSMLLDQSSNMLYLSHDIPDLDKLQPVFVVIWKMLNLPEFFNHQVPTAQYINESILFDIFGRISKNDIKTLDSNFTDQQVQSIWEYLINKGFINQNGECLVSKIEADIFKSLPNYIPEDHLRFLINKIVSRRKEIIIPNHLKYFVKTHLEIWIQSAIRAKSMDNNKHYVVDIDRSSSKHDCNPNIVILDHDTGNDLANSHWDEGLHQFIQLKHGCKLSLLSLKAVFISNVSYIKLYCKLNGLSGTLGSQSERDLLKEVYDVQYVTVPTAKPKIFTEYPPLICPNSRIWLDSIVKEVSKILPKRSALIICETVSDVNKLEDEFKKNLPPESFKRAVSSYKRDYQVLKGANNLEPGLIILSTNLAGRGTDIKPSDDLAKAGGLHVCLSFLSSNCRIEEQALGRVARNGVPGTAQLIFQHPIQSCSLSLIIDVKKQRDSLEDLRIQEIKTFYESKIKFEEDSFEKFKKAYDDLKSLMSHHKEDDIKSILLKECLDQWAFWLDCNSNQPNNSSIEDFLLNLSKIGGKDINTWSLQVKNPSNLLKLGLIFLQKSDLKHALFCFDKVLEMEPDFSGIANYYRVVAKFKHPSNDDKKKVHSELLRVRKQFKAHIHSLLVDINVVENLKIYTTGLIQYEFFKEQQESLIKVYMIHIQSIDLILGGNADHTLVGYENIVIDLAKKGILLKRTQGVLNEDNLSFVRKYGLDLQKLYLFLKGYKTKFEFKSIVDNFPLPSRELFWDQLLENKILINETRYIHFDFGRLEKIDPSLERKLRQLKQSWDNQEITTKDQIWFYQNHELPDSFSNTAYREDLIRRYGVGQERLTFLKERDVVISNRKATLKRDPLNKCALLFDSVCCDDFKNVGINHDLANEILDELKFMGILTEKLVANKANYSLAMNNIKELEDMQLIRFEGYSGDVKWLLNYHFSFRLALEDIFQKLQSGKHLTLHLDINPYKRLECDFIDHDIIKSVVCDEPYDKIFKKLFSKTKDVESWGEMFEKAYSKTEIFEIMPALIDIKVLSLSREINGKPHYEINTDDNGKIIWPDGNIRYSILQDENETIKLILEEHFNIPIEFIKQRLEESRGLINLDKDSNFYLTPIVDHLKQLECPTTEMALLSLNGFDQVLNYGEEKWTWKMITNVAVASALAIGQIGAGIAIATLTVNPVFGEKLFAEGVSDLVFCGTCCVTGMFSWKDYFLNKAISIGMSFLSMLKTVTNFFKKKGLLSEVVENSCSSATKTTANALVGANKMEIIKHLSANAAKSLSIGVACNALPHLIEPQCKQISTYLVDIFNARIDENLAHHPINDCIDQLHTVLGERKCKDTIKKKLEETIFECRSDSNNILAVTVVNVITALREALSLTIQVDENLDFAGLMLPLGKIAVSFAGIIKSAWGGKFKELYNVPGMLVNRLRDKLLLELTANQSEAFASDLVEDQRIETDISSQTRDKLQQLIKTDLADYLHSAIVFPFITSAGDIIAKSYSKQILFRTGPPAHLQLNRYDYSSQIFKNEDLDDSIRLSQEVVERNVETEESGKLSIGYTFLELEYDNILMILFKKNRSLKLFAEIIQKNVVPDENIFRMFCVLIPDVLNITGMDIPALEIVTYHCGTCEKYTADNAERSHTTVNIFSDEKIHVQDVLEATCKTISHICPQFTWKASDLLEQICGYIENYHTKLRGVKSTYSNKLEIDKSLVSTVPKCASDYKQLHPKGRWNFNSILDVDLREDKYTSNDNKPSSVCLKTGFNVALTKINDHIYKNQSHLRPPFKLSLEQFDIVDVTITTPTTSDPKTPFHSQPVHYELIMPFAVKDGTKLEDFKISLRLRCNRKHPQPFSPQGPHIVYEIEPIHINRDTFIIGVKGHILLSKDFENLEYTTEDCCVAGELILPSNLTISDNLASLIALVESRKVPWKTNSRRKRKKKQKNKLCR